MNPTALRTAIYTRLAEALAPIPVWTHVPQDQPYPYVRIGSLSAVDASVKGSELNEYEVQISAFTRDKVTKGPKPVETILRTIHTALHEQEAALTLETGHLVLIRCEFNTAFQPGEPNADYWQGVQRYRALIQDS